MQKMRIPLDFNPEFAAAIGRLVGYWAIAESELIALLGGLLLVDQRRAQMVFMTFISTRGKIDLIIRLAHMYIDKEVPRKQLLRLLETAGALNGERNRFVHATWAAGDDKDSLTRFENSLPSNLKKAFKPVEVLTVQDVQSVVDKIAQLVIDIGVFREDVGPTLLIRREPLA